MKIKIIFVILCLLVTGCVTTARGMYMQGKSLQEQGRIQEANQNYQLALLYMKGGVERGDPEAQNLLGVMYLNGNGVEQNIPKALELFTAAANQGNENAKENINLVHEYEAAVAKEKADAEARSIASSKASAARKAKEEQNLNDLRSIQSGNGCGSLSLTDQVQSNACAYVKQFLKGGNCDVFAQNIIHLAKDNGIPDNIKLYQIDIFLDAAYKQRCI